MSKLFNGMLLVFLDFNITIGASRIDVLPDFLGYIFIIQGLEQLAHESERFVKARPFAIAMGVYMTLIFVLELFGSGLSFGAIPDIILGLLSLAASLYISYSIVMGVGDMERTSGRDLDAHTLYKTWQWFVALMFITYIIVWIPVLNLVSLIAAIAASIAFLVAFNRSKKLYYGGY